jgi:hypothetical protein
MRDKTEETNLLREENNMMETGILATSFWLSAFQVIFSTIYIVFFVLLYLVWKDARDHGYPLRYWNGEFWILGLIIWACDSIAFQYKFSIYCLGSEGNSGAYLIYAWVIGMAIRFFMSK